MTLDEIERIVIDLPETLNLRLETIVAGQSETHARLSLVDRQLGTLGREVRDVRGAVTQLTLQQRDMSQRLGLVETHLSGNAQRFSDIEGRLVTFGSKLASVDTKIDGLSARHDALAAKVDGLSAKVDGLSARHDALAAKVDDLSARHDALAATVDGLAALMRKIADKLGV